MLARAPGDVAHANVAQVTVPRRQRGSPRPAWGNGAVCPATPGANAHGVPRTAVTSANGAPSRPRAAAGALSARPAPRGGPSPTGPRLGAAQHRDLVPQHEQFRIRERRRTTQQDKPASKPHEDQIEQTQRHGRSLCPTATPYLSRQVTAIGRLLAPHRFYVRALTIDRPRSVTAGVLRPGSAASSSWVGRPVAAAADSAGSLRGRLPGREAGRLGMGPAVVPGQDPAEVAGPAGHRAVADLAARDRKMGNGHGEAAGSWITHQIW